MAAKQDAALKKFLALFQDEIEPAVAAADPVTRRVLSNTLRPASVITGALTNQSQRLKEMARVIQLGSGDADDYIRDAERS